MHPPQNTDILLIPLIRLVLNMALPENQRTVIADHLEHPVYVGKEIVAKGAHLMNLQVFQLQILLALQQLTNYQDGNALNRYAVRILLKVYLQFQFKQVHVLAIEEVLQNFTEMLADHFDLNY
jgi:hypothetical protein